MLDPLNPTNNTGGKSTDCERLQNMFKTINYIIGLRLTEEKANADELL